MGFLKVVFQVLGAVAFFAAIIFAGNLDDIFERGSLVSDANGVRVYKDRQPPYTKTSGGERTHMANSKEATNPTYQELMTFLVKDGTDLMDYNVSTFPCGAFAESVHNNAEAAGIKAAWVALDFVDDEEGHALNAFETVDKGLVYVDCTGEQFLLTFNLAITFDTTNIFGEAGSWDKIAYISVGRAYGLVSLEVASSPEYTYYEQYQQRRQAFEDMLDDFNQKVIAFNQEVEEYNAWGGGRVIYQGTSDARKSKQWFESLSEQENNLQATEEELKKEGNSLGGFWESLGTVESVEIYW